MKKLINNEEIAEQLKKGRIMSDLIRREDVIKLVNQFVFGLCKEQNDEVRRTFNKYIAKMPTAYSVDKVIKEL